MTNIIKVPAAALFLTLFSLPVFAIGDKDKSSSETARPTNPMKMEGRCSRYPECNFSLSGE